jgi:hypothetical protein
VADALYRPLELTFRTQFAELRERAAASGGLLGGTPGKLVLRSGTGYGYWYRSYYVVPGQATEDFVCKDGDQASLESMRDRIAAADWTARQVRDLRKLGFQVADKSVARVLVELHNAGLFAAGLAVVGTLAYMGWLNELGARAVAARTQDIDLARRQALKLAAPVPLMQTAAATKLKLSPVPGLRAATPPTSLKLPGAEGLRIDLLTHGAVVGATVPVPELQWHAQAMPFYDYLLRDAEPVGLLAGGHCIPIRLPSAPQFVWHKTYSSAVRKGNSAKAQKDLLQAATLMAVLLDEDDGALSAAWSRAPAALKVAARGRLPALRRLLPAHPQALAVVERLLR